MSAKAGGVRPARTAVSRSACWALNSVLCATVGAAAHSRSFPRFLGGLALADAALAHAAPAHAAPAHAAPAHAGTSAELAGQRAFSSALETAARTVLNSPVRPAAHAGGAYPAEPEALREHLARVVHRRERSGHTGR